MVMMVILLEQEDCHSLMKDLVEYSILTGQGIRTSALKQTGSIKRYEVTKCGEKSVPSPQQICK